MFESHFGLRESPFLAGHLTRFVYPSREHQEVLAHLRFGIENREPFVLITGEVGTGKTTALYDVLAEWEGRVVVALLTNSALTRDELLEEIGLRFGLAMAPGVSKPHAMIQLERHLMAVRARGQRALLLLDEAQNLDRGLLEEIRLLSNLEFQGDKLIQVFLIGQPELEAKLARPELRQLRQRIAVHYRLQPLDGPDTERYIHHRLSVAGGYAPAIFPTAACAEVYRVTHGIPREINTVAGQAMLNAFVRGAAAVSPEDVRAVERESEFRSVIEAAEALPAPPEVAEPPAPPAASTPGVEPGEREEQRREPPPDRTAAPPDSWDSWLRSLDERAAQGEVQAEPPSTSVAPGAPEPPRAPEPFPPPPAAEAPPAEPQATPPPAPPSPAPAPVAQGPATAPASPPAKAEAREADAPSRPAPAPDPPHTTPSPSTPAAGAGGSARGPAASRHPAADRATPSPRRADAALPPRLREKLEEAESAPKDGASNRVLAALVGVAVIAAIFVAGALAWRFDAWPPFTRMMDALTGQEHHPKVAAVPAAPVFDPNAVAAGADSARSDSSAADVPTSATAAAATQEPVETSPAPATEEATPTSKPEVATPKEPPPTRPAPARHYALAVGTYMTQERAERERVKLTTGTELPGRLHRVREDGVWMYRVLMGRFDDRLSAERVASDLIKKGLVDEARVVTLASAKP